MNARIIQIVCALYMVAMSFAAATHWWSLRSFSNAAKEKPSFSHITAALPPSAAPEPTASVAPPGAPQTPPAAFAAPAPPSSPSSSQHAFYTSLLSQIENLQNQNRDLIDQLAETNRELMKLEFRVDTHSSQFRPLPVTEERQDASVDESYGVLPPRPLIIDEPFPE